jgi:aryl-alcohol dehydrogenase-like predicted oxidoreductase
MMDKTISLGTANFGSKYGLSRDSAPSRREVLTILEYAVGKIEYLDCACDYLGSHELLRDYAKLFSIVTKFSPTAIDRKDSTEALIERELERLGIVSFDTILIRASKSYADPRYMKSWIILKKFKEQGVVKRIGFSIYEPKEIELCTQRFDGIDTFQVPENIANRKFSEYLSKNTEFSEKFSFAVRSIFMQGLLLIEGNKIPKTLQSIEFFREKLKAQAIKLNMTYFELVCQYVEQLHWPQSVVLGVNSIQQLQSWERTTSQFKETKINFDFLQEMPILQDGVLDPRNWTCT